MKTLLLLMYFTNTVMVTNALSFYRSNSSGQSNLFWTGPNYVFMDMDIIWTCPKQIGPVQNNFTHPK